MQSDKVSRREYLKYIGSFVIGAVIFGGGVAAYYASLPPAKEVITKTITTTVPGPTVTRTVTVTAMPSQTPTPTPTPSPTPSPTSTSNQSLVSIVRGNLDTDIEFMVRKSIDSIGGMEKIVSVGKTVVIKPAVYTSDKNCAPDARVVAAIAKLAKERGGKVIVAESSGSGSTLYNLSRVGITSAIEEVGAEVRDLQAEKEILIRVPDGVALHEVKTYPTILNCDVLISVPRLKRHTATMVTISLKNMMGTIPRNEMLRFHRLDLSQCIADLNTVIKPHLTLVDATYVMSRQGPTGGEMIRMNTIITSKDPVAADRVAAQELQKLEQKNGIPSFDASNVKHINAAAALKVGINDLNKINIIEKTL